MSSRRTTIPISKKLHNFSKTVSDKLTFANAICLLSFVLPLFLFASCVSAGFTDGIVRYSTENFRSKRNQELATAIFYRDLTRVKSIVATGVDLNAVGTNGETALLFSLTNRSTDIIEYLLDKGANPNLTDPKVDNWSNVMIVATRKTDPKFLEILLMHGGDPNSGVQNYLLFEKEHPKGYNPNYTPLLEAMWYGEEEKRKLLLAAGAKPSWGDSIYDSLLWHSVPLNFELAAYLVRNYPSLWTENEAVRSSCIREVKRFMNGEVLDKRRGLADFVAVLREQKYIDF